MASEQELRRYSSSHYAIRLSAGSACVADANANVALGPLSHEISTQLAIIVRFTRSQFWSSLARRKYATIPVDSIMEEVNNRCQRYCLFRL